MSPHRLVAESFIAYSSADMFVLHRGFRWHAIIRASFASGYLHTFGMQQRRCCDVRGVISLLRRQHMRQQNPHNTKVVSFDICDEGNGEGFDCQTTLETSQLIACCENMCQENKLLDLSADERVGATQLLISALAKVNKRGFDSVRRHREGASNGSCETKEKVEIKAKTSLEGVVLWDLALRLFLNLPSSEGGVSLTAKQQIDLCGSLLQCLIHFGAPQNVVKAAYQTLHTSLMPPSSTSSENFPEEVVRRSSHLHVSYARYLLKCASGGGTGECDLSLHKDAFRILLLDCPERGLPLGSDGYLMILEILRRITTGEVPSLKIGPQEENGCHDGVNDMLWSEFDPAHHSSDILAAGRACCLRVVQCHGPIGTAQEAFCRFVSVGMQLQAVHLNPFLRSRHSIASIVAPEGFCVKFNPQLYIQFLNGISDMLQSELTRRSAISHVLEGPCILSQRQRLAGTAQDVKTSHVCVWLVRHILRRQHDLQKKATGPKGGVEKDKFFMCTNSNDVCKRNYKDSCGDDSLQVWKEGTEAALRCLRHLLLRLPEGRSGHRKRQRNRDQVNVRQEVFCLLFQGVLDGLFYTATAEGEITRETGTGIPPVMVIFTQSYNQWDWRYPSVSIFVECLYTWGMHDMVKDVFSHIYRYAESRWNIDEQKQLTDEEINNEDCGVTTRWKGYSLPLRTCEMIIESSCKNDDPATAALAVAYMLRQLLSLKAVEHNMCSSRNEGCEETDGVNTDVCEVESRCVEEWTRMIKEEIIPQIDEVFRRTGVDTNKQWLTDLTDAKNAVGSTLR